MNFEELKKDEELARMLKQAKDMDEVVDAFRAKGIDTSREALEKLLELADSADELNEERLEEVAGGAWIPGVTNYWPWNRPQDIKSRIAIAYWIGYQIGRRR